VVAAHCSKKARPDYTDIDATEFCEASDGVMRAKIQVIAELVKKAKNMILFTGAGISTNSGIRDYATKARDSRTKFTKSLSRQRGGGPSPTIAHRVLTQMFKAGYVKR